MKEDLQKLLINYDYFEKLTGIQGDEIKYGITPEDAKKMMSDELQKIRKTSTFEFALNKARLEKNKKLPFSRKISTLMFYSLFVIMFLALVFQISIFIFDWLFQTQFLSFKIPALNIPLYYVAIPLGFWIGSCMAQSSNEEFLKSCEIRVERLESLKRLRKIFLECENYNKILKSINVKDQIANVLDRNSDETRQEILSLLEKIRNNLVKALKIDKIIRENSDIISITEESLEITFAELQYADITSHANQYSEFVDEVLNLGINLNREFEMLRSSSY